MASAIYKLNKSGLITPPKWLPANLIYECQMGSVAYGVATESSDHDIYGVAIPKKEVVFPHLSGVIEGFGYQGEKFDQYSQHHVIDINDKNKEYDFTIYSIIKYFALCADCNPNMIDSLFVPDVCVKHITSVGQIIRDNRHLFLSKMAWPRFRGYAYAQLHKISNKEPVGNRIELVQKHGYDVKFAYHVIRLLDEAQQILENEWIDLQRNNDELKAIRRGEFTELQLRENAAQRIKILDNVYANSKLRAKPNMDTLKVILMECLEQHYGNLSAVIVVEHKAITALKKIAEIIDNASI